MRNPEYEMIRDLVAKFVTKELRPLENTVLQRSVEGHGFSITPEQETHLRTVSKELGLWGLDAPEDLGGQGLPTSAMIYVWQEIAKTAVHFKLPPDSPNLRMLAAIGTPEQKAKYLQPYIDGTITSAIAISEPGAGGDPASIATKAEFRDGSWVLNGRKAWISVMDKAQFAIVIARVGNGKRQEGITSFIVERDAPGFIIERAVPMLYDYQTFEIAFDDCRIPEGNLLGEIGHGYEPMQMRLRTRRLEMACTAVGYTERALEMLIDHAKQRVTFGIPLSDRQAIQWWIADAGIRLHACKLMIEDAAAKVDEGEAAAQEISIVKVLATEMAYDIIDYAMQTLGALGMTRETVLYPMWQHARLMRIYEGPSEVHRQAIARRLLNAR